MVNEKIAAHSFMTVVGDIIRTTAQRSPDKTGFIFQEHRYTWREVNERVNSLANALADLGLGKGDRCAIIDINSHRYMEIHLALGKMGVTAVPLNARLAGRELAYMINNTEVKAIFVLAQYRKLIEPIHSQLHSVKHYIGMDNEHGYSLDYERLISKYPSSEPEVAVEPQDLWRIVHTGGTTGVPKGVMCSHLTTMTEVLTSAFNYRQVPSDIWHAGTAGLSLIGQPLLCLDYMLLGCTLVFDDWDAQRFVETVDRERCTSFVLAPPMVPMLRDRTNILKRDMSHVRLVCYGASPMPVPWIYEMQRMFPKADLFQIYGATEVNLDACHLRQEDHRLDGSEKMTRRLRSVGRPDVNVAVRIVGADDNEVPRGQVGELVVKSPQLMDGYYKQPEMTAEALKHGWYHMGDLGYMDEDGYIYLVERKQDMIKTGAFRVYSKEVEDAVGMHPAVDEVAVIGVPHTLWGEAIKAIVKLKPGMKASEEEIIEFCKPNIGSYKVPKSIDFVEDFPRNILHKIQKNVLREKYWAGYETRVWGGGEETGRQQH